MDIKFDSDEEDLPDLIDSDLLKTENSQSDVTPEEDTQGLNIAKNYIDTNTNDVDTTEIQNMQCTFCLETFNSEYLFNIHQMLHDPNHYCFICKRIISHDMDVHVMGKHFNQCNVCLKTFTLEKALNSHMQLHTGVLTYFTCNQCDKVFRQRGSLSVHIRASHQGIKPFACALCENNIKFTTSSGFRRHMRRFHDPNNPINNLKKCIFCPEILEGLKEKRRHEARHIATKMCKECNKTFDTAKNFKKHFVLVHPLSGTYSCYECWATFTKPHSLKIHIKNVHESTKKKIFCKECCISYAQIKSLHKHNQKYHNPDKPCKITEKDLTCKMCLKMFPNLGERRKHVCKLQKNLSCKYCQQMFKNTHELGLHVNKEHNRLKQCQYCRRLYSEYELICHLQTIHKERKCFHCPKVFYSYSNFHKHLLSHNIPIICEICNQNLDNTNIDNHKIQHVQKVTCQVCHKSVLDLATHIDKHHTCFLCDLNVKFATVYGLKVHYKRHHPHMAKCSICHESIKKSQFNSHLKEMHNIQKFYECNKCFYIFYGLSAFNAHKNRHAGYRSHCENCFKMFLSKQKHEEHNCADILDEERLYCHLCNIEYMSKITFITHMVQNHSPTISVNEEGKILEQTAFQKVDINNKGPHKNKKFQCTKCFRVIVGKIMHFCIPKNLKRSHYKCNLCGRLEVRRKYMINHTISVHGIQNFWTAIQHIPMKKINRQNKSLEVYTVPVKMEYLYKCKRCGRRFKFKRTLDRHKCVSGRHHCHLCDIKYRNNNSLTKHMRIYHSPMVILDHIEREVLEKIRVEETIVLKNKEKRYQCKTCFKVLRNISTVKKHFCGRRHPTILKNAQLLDRKNKRVVTCNECAFTSLTRRTMKNHFFKYHKNTDACSSETENCNPAETDFKIEIKEECLL